MRTGLGFMVNALVYMALMRVDLLVLGVVASEASVGLYRVAVEGGQLVAFSYAAATIVLAPEYARLHAAGEHGRLQLLVRQSSRIIMFVGVFAAIPLTVFSKEIVVAVFGAEYARAAVALSILAVGNFITFFFGDPVFLLNMTGHHNRITVLVGISLVISVVLSLVLIPYYGIVGAAIASATTLICYRALAFREVYKRLEINCAVLGPHPEQQRDKAHSLDMKST